MDTQPADLISWYQTIKKQRLGDRSSDTFTQYESQVILTPREAVAVISLISIAACSIDIYYILSQDAPAPRCECCDSAEQVTSMKLFILTLFQIGNMLLLVAAVMESASIVQVYVWCTMSYVVLGLAVALMDFLLRVKNEGPVRACLAFVPEVSFLFVLFRCLPLVDGYGRDIETAFVR